MTYAPQHVQLVQDVFGEIHSADSVQVKTAKVCQIEVNDAVRKADAKQRVERESRMSVALAWRERLGLKEKVA